MASVTSLYRRPLSALLPPARALPLPGLTTADLAGRPLPRVVLIDKPTEVHTLRRLTRDLGLRSPLQVKREDQTSNKYGGNKVRNLEFILADVLRRDERAVKTLLPMGSNFSAAIASEARALGIGVELHQFVAERNEQTLAHADFARRQGARIRQFGGASGLARAGLSYLLDPSAPVAPGGSSPLGAVGHARAFLEYVQQCAQQQEALAERVVVATGTCGTLAGLLAGNALAGRPAHFIAVRCAHPAVCNARKILFLANRCLRLVGSLREVTAEDFRIVEAPGHVAYGVPSPAAALSARRLFDLEGLYLDVTYTAKAMSAFEDLVRRGEIGRHGERLLYWHTYSPRAHRTVF